MILVNLVELAATNGTPEVALAPVYGSKHRQAHQRRQQRSVAEQNTGSNAKR
jgi:hypothetical protein